jgi:Beta propeller domain
VPTRSFIYLLGLLSLAGPAALAQQTPKPSRVMQAFRSETELVQYLAALDRSRRSPGGSAESCPDSISASDKKGYLITGRVQSSTGQPVANAVIGVAGVEGCAVAKSDGSYRLAIPRKYLRPDSSITVSAAFIGYHRSVRTVKPIGRQARADFVLKENPVQLSELSVAAPAAADAMAANGAKYESITNTQHAGVDEGGIVKLHGDYLVVLRRGRLFTISIHDRELRPVATVDAYPPGADPAEWYDELLISGDRVIVIGYSYRRGGTEVGLFAIDGKGGLRHLSTSHLRSYDYYSSRNYASRLVGGKLVYYTALPLQFGGDPWAQLPALREWRPGSQNEFERIVTPRRVYRPARSLAGSQYLTQHTITTCNVGGTRLECEATVVLGPYSRVFYVSPASVYVWTAEWPWNSWPGHLLPAVLYRLPLDGSEPTALSVAGSPVDQFSFLESEDKHLNVLVRADAAGDAMWSAEWTGYGPIDSMALLRVPLDRFDDGRAQARQEWYRGLPAPPPGTFHNRFVGDHLLYGAGSGWGMPKGDSATAFVVRYRGGDVARLGLSHGVDRIEVMGEDAVIVGQSGANLHFTGVRLGGRPSTVQHYVLENASQGELRSHGFFYKPQDRHSGILGLPVRGGVKPGYEHLIHGSASIVFLQNGGRDFTELGALASAEERPVDDACKASCVDWYGNARPIFLRGRIFALLGYELVEGALERNAIREIQRASFAPGPTETTLRRWW